MIGDMEILGRAPAPYPNNDQGPRGPKGNIPQSFGEFYRTNKDALDLLKGALAAFQSV